MIKISGFSDVYNTEEYKAKAYPVSGIEDVNNNKFTWSDGITQKALKLSGNEKAD